MAGELHQLPIYIDVVLVIILCYIYLLTKGGVVIEVKVDYFLVFFCGGGWSWHIVWLWCLCF